MPTTSSGAVSSRTRQCDEARTRCAFRVDYVSARRCTEGGEATSGEEVAKIAQCRATPRSWGNLGLDARRRGPGKRSSCGARRIPRPRRGWSRRRRTVGGGESVAGFGAGDRASTSRSRPRCGTSENCPSSRKAPRTVTADRRRWTQPITAQHATEHIDPRYSLRSRWNEPRITAAPARSTSHQNSMGPGVRRSGDEAFAVYPTLRQLDHRELRASTAPPRQELDDRRVVVEA